MRAHKVASATAGAARGLALQRGMNITPPPENVDHNDILCMRACLCRVLWACPAASRAARAVARGRGPTCAEPTTTPGASPVQTPSRTGVLVSQDAYSLRSN